MISKSQMFEPMLVACPSFTPRWQEFVEESERHPAQEPLYYLVLGDLARHLLEKLISERTEEFPAVFRVVELWCCGSEEVRTAAKVGLLEGIQNNASHLGVDDRMFEPWFMDETRKAWDALNSFWEGKD